MVFPAMRDFAIAAFLCVVLMLAWGPALIDGFQGQSTATRPARAANIQTKLAPIQVDFRDVAEKAGLTAINVTEIGRAHV